MNLRPKTEPGSPLMAMSAPADVRNLKQMSVSELVSVLRTAFRIDDFDRVEEVLVARDVKLKVEIEEKLREIVSLQQKIDVERMNKKNVEEELKKCKELSEKGKRAQESYEKLLKELKKSGLEDKNTNELRKKNRELDGEIRKVEELKKKWVDDKNAAVAELKIKNRELEEEKLKMEAEKKDWLDDRNTIAELRIEIIKLAEEKRAIESLVESKEKKFWELNERVLRLENDLEILMNADATGGGNTEGESQDDPGPGVHFEAKKDDLGASAKGTDRTVIEIEDSDDDMCISQRALHGKVAASRVVADDEHPSLSGAVQKKNLSKGVEAIEMLKRKVASSREFDTNINILDRLAIDTSSSSSSSDSFDLDNIPSSILGVTSNKKRKTN